jgi:hypothetical protein
VAQLWEAPQVNLLIHVEQYDVVGILPSQLESLAHVAKMAGVNRCGFVDATADGVRRCFGFERYASIADWREKEEPSSICVFSPGAGMCVTECRPGQDTWLVFGRSMGITMSDFDELAVDLVHIPGGDLSSRDAVPIALWEVGSWPAQ